MKAIFDEVGLPIHPVWANTNIKAGDDILISYGDSYWDFYKEKEIKQPAADGFPSDRVLTSINMWDGIEASQLRAVCKPIRMQRVKVQPHCNDVGPVYYLAVCSRDIAVGDVVGILGGRVLEDPDAPPDPNSCIYYPAGCKLAIEAENECRSSPLSQPPSTDPAPPLHQPGNQDQRYRPTWDFVMSVFAETAAKSVCLVPD